MRSAGFKIALLAVLVAVAVGLFIVLQGGDDDEGSPATTPEQAATGGRGEEPDSPERDRKPPEPEIPTIVVRGGEPVGGIRELSFTAGDEVAFEVRSDVMDEIHVHGYDLIEEVAAGEAATVRFDADIEGLFEVELEHTGVHIAELSVQPG